MSSDWNPKQRQFLRSSSQGSFNSDPKQKTIKTFFGSLNNPTNRASQVKSSFEQKHSPNKYNLRPKQKKPSQFQKPSQLPKSQQSLDFWARAQATRKKQENKNFGLSSSSSTPFLKSSTPSNFQNRKTQTIFNSANNNTRPKSPTFSSNSNFFKKNDNENANDRQRNYSSWQPSRQQSSWQPSRQQSSWEPSRQQSSWEPSRQQSSWEPSRQQSSWQPSRQQSSWEPSRQQSSYNKNVFSVRQNDERYIIPIMNYPPDMYRFYYPLDKIQNTCLICEPNKPARYLYLPKQLLNHVKQALGFQGTSYSNLQKIKFLAEQGCISAYFEQTQDIQLRSVNNPKLFEIFGEFIKTVPYAREVVENVFYFCVMTAPQHYKVLVQYLISASMQRAQDKALIQSKDIQHHHLKKKYFMRLMQYQNKKIGQKLQAFQEKINIFKRIYKFQSQDGVDDRYSFINQITQQSFEDSKELVELYYGKRDDIQQFEYKIRCGLLSMLPKLRQYKFLKDTVAARRKREQLNKEEKKGLKRNKKKSYSGQKQQESQFAQLNGSNGQSNVRVQHQKQRELALVRKLDMKNLIFSFPQSYSKQQPAKLPHLHGIEQSKDENNNPIINTQFFQNLLQGKDIDKLQKITNKKTFLTYITQALELKISIQNQQSQQFQKIFNNRLFQAKCLMQYYIQKNQQMARLKCQVPTYHQLIEDPNLVNHVVEAMEYNEVPARQLLQTMGILKDDFQQDLQDIKQIGDEEFRKKNRETLHIRAYYTPPIKLNLKD